MSQATQLVEIVWHCSKLRPASNSLPPKLRQLMNQVLTLAIEAQFNFWIDDLDFLVEIFSKDIGHNWIDSDQNGLVGGNHYRVACQCNNVSFCETFEQYHKITPLDK
jgi:hypothetical protein